MNDANLFLQYQFILIIFIIIFVVILTVSVLYLLTLQNTINLTNPKNRSINPSEVWQTLIPIIGVFLHIGHINRTEETLKLDFNEKGIKYNNESQFGALNGYQFCLLIILNYAINIFLFYQKYKFQSTNEYNQELTYYFQSENNNIIYLISGIVSLLSFIIWITYWVKVSNCKNLLLMYNAQSHNLYSGSSSFNHSKVKDKQCKNCNSFALVEDKFCMKCGSSDFISNIDTLRKEIEVKKEILKLKKLFHSGIITEKEFIEQKENLLSDSDDKRVIEDLKDSKKVEISINEKECPSCKFIINKDIEKCEFCDYDFINLLIDKEDEFLVEPKLEQYQAENDNQNSKKGLYVLIGFIVLIIFGTWFYIENQNKRKNDKEFPLSVSPEVTNTDSSKNENYSIEDTISNSSNDTILKITITDNSYIEIGNQQWMSKNLNITEFQNGDPIPQAKNKNDWEKFIKLKKPAWCFFEFNSKHDRLGKIYNWHAVFDSRGLAPSSWHIPNMDEWHELINYLGGEKKAVNKMVGEKWESYMGGDYIKRPNESGFNAIIAGEIDYYDESGASFIIDRTSWWSSEKPREYYNSGSPELHKSNDGICILENFYLYDSALGEGDGCYVRCIKD